VLRTPLQMRKKDGTPFKVFTPCYKQWLASLTPLDWASYEIADAGRYANYEAAYKAAQEAGLQVLNPAMGATSLLETIGYVPPEDPLWPVHPAAVRAQLEGFVAEKMARYSTGRDQLAQRGTSRLSPYLRHGLISIRALMRAAQDQAGSERWISELCWREFYISILYHFPEVQTHELQAQYRHGAIPWNRSPEAVAALHEGRTGYPVIDAAIQELLQTGWMHNRARMIVAAFFTKDLLLDWRIGEAFFAEHLMDYELASNNGGWQWAASTGTDAAPYFRVFNPDLQSAKFDPEGEYIRRYLPQLRAVPTAALHRAGEAHRACRSYPEPMVDHAQAKLRAVEVFKAAGKEK
jgi:deoxyribodipyrimidine photo-lyase